MMYQTLARAMRTGDRLHIRCAHCDHTATWDRATALKRLGPDRSPWVIKHRLRCGGCGRKGGVEVWI